MDYYAVLGVDRQTSCDEIKIVFRKLALKLHPDKNSGTGNTKDQFSKVLDAYRVLSDPQKRQEYDQMQLIRNMESLRFESGFPSSGMDERTDVEEEQMYEDNSAFTNSYNFFGKSPLDVLKSIFEEDDDDFGVDFSKYMTADTDPNKVMDDLRDTFSPNSGHPINYESLHQAYGSHNNYNQSCQNLSDQFTGHFDSAREDSPQSPFSDSSFGLSDYGKQFQESLHNSRGPSQFKAYSSKPNSCTMTPVTEFRHVASSIYDQIYDAERSPFYTINKNPNNKMKSPVMTSPSPSLSKVSRKIAKPAKIDPRLYMKSNVAPVKKP